MSARPMKDVLKFQLEFMLMMHACGREEEAFKDAWTDFLVRITKMHGKEARHY